MNNNTTLNKYLALIVTFFCALTFGYGQTKLAELTFETAGGYSTTIPEFTDIVGGINASGRDYFIRTDGSNINGETFNNIQGNYYFAAQDIDGEGAILPVTFLMNNVNISGYSNIELRVYLAEDDLAANQNWDNPDFVHFNYDIDNSGTFTNLLWIENDGSTFNSAPFIDTDFDGTGDGAEITDIFTQFTQNIPGTGALLDIEIVFALDAEDEDIAIDNIEIWGTLIPCASTVTWTVGGWVPVSGPDISTEVIIATNYNTTANGNFRACNLTVNAGVTLRINNGDNVEVQNDILANGDITVETEGAVVQLGTLGTVTENGTITVIKTTPPLNVWYEYIYWSSPVFGETVGDALTDADVSRRFSFDGSNFLDAEMEAGNNNATLAGQDDIDDDNNDWNLVNGADIMTPGLGYASTHKESVFFNPGALPYKFDYRFYGPFNNGVIPVPIYRNDEETNDNNWNLIGNPYPSAIDVDLFLSTNSSIDVNVVTPGPIDGAIFLWSQNTLPAVDNNGNQNLNFDTSDYAIINGTASSAGGDLVIPNRFIPSGQSFFVSMSDTSPSTFYSVGDPGVAGDIVTTDIIFNNSMRVKGVTDNSQFFRITNSKVNNVANKAWFNLTSDNGIFSQTVVGYVTGATNNYDGTFFDAPRNLSTDISAILYTNIVDSDKKFAIQGKAENSINKDEVISLGFKTTIDVATIYTLSIAQLEGDFLSNNAIYVKDNLLNMLHDLKTGDYNFTSEVGEFNERFEIVFNSEALSTDEHIVKNKALSIIEQRNGDVQFKLSGNLAMASIQIIDLQGRVLYNLNANGNSKTYNLSNLSQAPYIAKVTLTDGYVITKKAIKRH